MPLRLLAKVEESDGPNQVLRENGQRRIVVQANGDGSATCRPSSPMFGASCAPTRSFRAGYFTQLEGTFKRRRRLLSSSASCRWSRSRLIFMVLYQRYQSAMLAGIIMANVPLALIGSVIALWLAGQPFSVASMIGFITLAGIATRNGILKISHYINLALFEGETFGPALVIRGSQSASAPC